MRTTDARIDDYTISKVLQAIVSMRSDKGGYGQEQWNQQLELVIKKIKSL